MQDIFHKILHSSIKLKAKQNLAQVYLKDKSWWIFVHYLLEFF